MKQLKILAIGALSILMLSSMQAKAVVNPSAVNIKIYGVAVSTNADCSNAKVIGYNEAGTTFDFILAPAIASGTIAAGTYNCVVLYMNSVISYVPATTENSCTANQTYSDNLCNQANSCVYTQATPDANLVLQYTTDSATPAGTTHTDTTNTDKIMLFLSTSSTNDGSMGGTFLRPSAATWATRGLTLTAPLVVSAAGGVGGEFVVNFNGKVDGSGVSCTLNPPVFSFR